MKVDIIRSIIAFAISALLAYACYEICNYERVQWIVAIGALFTLGTPLMLALGISSKQERSSVMLKTLSSSVFCIELLSNGIFVFFDFNVPLYVIINGLILVVFILIYNSIYRTKM